MNKEEINEIKEEALKEVKKEYKWWVYCLNEPEEMFMNLIIEKTNTSWEKKIKKILKEIDDTPYLDIGNLKMFIMERLEKTLLGDEK